MTLFAADILEPYVDESGQALIFEGYGYNSGVINRISAAELYQPDAYNRQEIELCEDLMANRWPLPDLSTLDKEDILSLQEISTRIVRYLHRYIWLRDDRQYELIANWVISTYFREEFYYAPILIFDGLSNCGKTSAIYALEQIVYRGERFDSASAAAIAREIEDYHPTMLLDEILDALNSDRGLDLFTMLRSVFSKDGSWIRADPKGRKNYRYKTFSHVALSIRGDTLPDDIYNRAIRINMTAAPLHVSLKSILTWREDDSGKPESPDTIRDALYKLRIWHIMYGELDPNGTGPIENWQMCRTRTEEHMTRKTNTGQWMYAYINDMPADSPEIRDRNRNIASTLYSVAVATNSEKDTIELIIENSAAQRETVLDTPEALTFISMLELIDENWEKIRPLHHKMSRASFLIVADEISTTDIAQRYNDILLEQGNAGREPVSTKTITAKLNAMGFKYSREGGHGGNKSWLMPEDKFFIPLFVRFLKYYAPSRYEDYAVLVNKNDVNFNLTNIM